MILLKNTIIILFVGLIMFGGAGTSLYYREYDDAITIYNVILDSDFTLKDKVTILYTEFKYYSIFVIVVFVTLGMVLFILTQSINQNPKSSKFATPRELFKYGLISSKKRGIIIGYQNPNIYKILHAHKGLLIRKKYNPIKLLIYIEYKLRLINHRIGFRQKKFLKISGALKESLSAILLAPPGTGKSAGYIMPTLMNNEEDSAVLLDVKADIYKTTSKKRAKHTNIIKLDLLNPDSDVSFNPFDKNNLTHGLIKNLTQIDIICNLAITNTGGDSYWSDEARTYLTSVAKACYILNSDYEAGNLNNGYTSFPEMLTNIYYNYESPDVIKNPYYDTLQYIQQQEPKKEHDKSHVLKVMKFLLEEILENFSQHSMILVPIISSLNTYSEMPDKQFAGNMGIISAQLKVFNNPEIQRKTNTNDIIFEDLFVGDKPTTIYVIARADEIPVLAVIINIFFEQFSNHALSRGDKKRDFNALMLIDEMPRLGKMKSVINLPALSRSAGVSAFFIAQTLNQLAEVYGREVANQIADTVAYQIFLTQNSAQSAKDLIEISGKSTKTKTVQTIRKNTKETSIQEQDESFLKPEDITSLQQGECIITGQYMPNIIKTGVPFYFLFKN